MERGTNCLLFSCIQFIGGEFEKCGGGPAAYNFDRAYNTVEGDAHR